MEAFVGIRCAVYQSSSGGLRRMSLQEWVTFTLLTGSGSADCLWTRAVRARFTNGRLFMRYIAASGRLSEFLGAGADDANLKADIRARGQLYSSSELADQFTALSPNTRAAYSGFAMGIQARVQEVNADPLSLLPYEFSQVYGSFQNYSAGRNRGTVPLPVLLPSASIPPCLIYVYELHFITGYLPANDFLFEPLNRTHLVRNDTVAIRNQSNVTVPVYISETGGFVVDRGDEALTLRSVFYSRELLGLSNLIEMFFVVTMDQYLSNLRNEQLQSHLTHSHLLYADNDGNIAAALNGLWTDLSGLQRSVDRRLPQGVDGAAVPVYTYDEVVRSQWMVSYVQNAGQMDFAQVQNLSVHNSLSCALKLGGRGDFDAFNSSGPKFLDIA
eukprot:gene65-2342_t